MELLTVSNLILSPDIQPRTAMDMVVIQEYADEMKSGTKFPPIEVVFDGQDYWVWDGFHRAKAARSAQLAQIAANVQSGTKQDAQWLALSANKSHGLRRSNADKRRTVELALKNPRSENLSDNQIAQFCGVAQSFVTTVAGELSSLKVKMPGREHKRYVKVKRGTQEYWMNPERIGENTSTNEIELSDHEHIIIGLVHGGCVYLMESNGLYKIGMATSLRSRLFNHKTSNPFIRLVWAIPSSQPVVSEREWHSKFADKRASGEWFKLEEEDILNFCDQAIIQADGKPYSLPIEFLPRNGSTYTMNTDHVGKPKDPDPPRIESPALFIVNGYVDRVIDECDQHYLENHSEVSPYYQNQQVTVYNCDFRKILPSINDGFFVFDPPYNIGFKYDLYQDNLPDEDYIEMLRQFHRFSKVVIIQYPEEMQRLVVPALGAPDHCSVWCYNSNTSRRFRLINWYGLTPDYSRIKQPYKNPTDRRVAELIANGNEGTDLYEWWTDIQIVKNVSPEKTGHPCPIPEALIKRIITLGADPEDVIIDPFAGSLTTLKVAQDLGYRAIGMEISEAYIKDGLYRLSQFNFSTAMSG